MIWTHKRRLPELAHRLLLLLLLLLPPPSALIPGVHPAEGGAGRADDGVRPPPAFSVYDNDSVNYAEVEGRRSSTIRQAEGEDGYILPRAVADFTRQFYVWLAEGRPGDASFAFSPLSLHAALSLLYLGAEADHETFAELRDALGGLANVGGLEASYRALAKWYRKEGGGGSFLYGNKLWVGDDADVKEAYRRSIVDNFDAEIERVDFGGPQSVEKVNRWVSKKTRGLISRLVEGFGRDTKFLLTNALYFKGRWRYPFNLTSPEGGQLDREGFYTAVKKGDGGHAYARSEVQMMWQKSSAFTYGVINSLGNQKADVVTLPYENPDYEMQLIIPRKDDPKALHRLENEMLMQVRRNIGPTHADYFNIFSYPKNDSGDIFLDDVTVKMPVFDVNSDIEATDILKKMGVETAFSASARFDKITDTPLKVSNIKHKAVVSVNNEGTELAAATDIQLELLSASFKVRLELVFNRAFIFVVHDRRHNIPILVGRVANLG